MEVKRMFELPLERFRTFREELHGLFARRADALMDLLDSLAGNRQADSPVKLSLDALFRRRYGSLHDAVDNFAVAEPGTSATGAPAEGEPAKGAPAKGAPAKGAPAKGAPAKGELAEGAPAKGAPLGQWAPVSRLVAAQLPRPEQRPFWLLATDVTPAPRPFARTLADRGIVYAPNAAPGNRPIAVGHSYSAVVALPEKSTVACAPWVVPLSLERVPTSASGLAVGAAQLRGLCTDEQLPFAHCLTVNAADSAYSAVAYLCAVGEVSNLVTVVRMPGNRVLYRSPDPNEYSGHGRRPWYGARFALQEPATRGVPDQVVSFPEPGPKLRQITLEVWYDMKRRGRRGLPMHQHPFTLVRCTVTDEHGQAVYRRPMWFIVLGSRRAEVTPRQAWSAYGQRYDIEHFFRFGKQRLLMGSYQTPEVEHEEHWWQLTTLAYVQLWLARPLARVLPNPWERPVPATAPEAPPSPSLVQRDFERIIRLIGTPAPPPKPRGNSPGRRSGESPGRRPRLPVIVKKRNPELEQAP